MKGPEGSGLFIFTSPVTASKTEGPGPGRELSLGTTTKNRAEACRVSAGLACSASPRCTILPDDKHLFVNRSPHLPSKLFLPLL